MKRKKIVGLIIFMVLLLGIVFFFFLCSVKTVKISGNEYYSEDDIKEKLMTEITDKNTILFFFKIFYGKRK